MPRRPGELESTLYPIGETSGRLLRADGVFEKVENFYATEEGGYRSAVTPAPILWTAAGGVPTSSEGGEDVSGPVYGRMKGIFHARLNQGQRDVLLVHTGAQLWVFEGWNRAWRCLVGPSSASPQLELELPDTPDDAWATQFVSVTNGIVIVPQNARALFYDGEVIAPLGYDQRPGPPQGRGPEDSSTQYVGPGANQLHGVNDVGYRVDRLVGQPAAMDPIFKFGRIGTASTFQAAVTTGDAAAGQLEPGRWRARQAFVDRWGNISPLSPPSNDVRFTRQPSRGWNGVSAYWLSVEHVLKQLLWEGLNPGPAPQTVGRVLYRTKDLVNSGTAAYFEVPLNALDVPGSFATMPDNVSAVYCDNIPDAWLVNEAVEYDPVPTFKLAAVAFGRLWVANAPGQEGMVRPSEVGLWGTMPINQEIWPDPNGAEITGLHSVPQGLLVFTERSTFLIVESDDGQRFRRIPVSTTVGCIAPSSIATTRWGETIWLGHDGFYRYTGGEPEFIFDEWREYARGFNSGVAHKACAYFDSRSGEYRCWVAFQGSRTNNRMWQWDGSNWRWCTHSSAVSACRRMDHTEYGYFVGDVGANTGAFVLDTGFGGLEVGTLTTGWMRSQDASKRATVRRVSLYLRETQSTSTDSEKIQISFERDWRAGVVSTDTADLTYTTVPKTRFPGSTKTSPSDTNSSFWGTDTYGGTDVRWRKRRLFVTKNDIMVPACEVFRMTVTCPGTMEVVGVLFHEEPMIDGGARRTSG